MITMYGIANCQTVQKARNFLESKGIQYEFWDYKKQGIDQAHLAKWCKKFGWEKVLNRSGMMWRKAPEIDKAKVADEQSAIDFMIAVPTSIKRPVLETDGGVLLGFDEGQYSKIL